MHRSAPSKSRPAACNSHTQHGRTHIEWLMHILKKSTAYTNTSRKHFELLSLADTGYFDMHRLACHVYMLYILCCYMLRLYGYMLSTRHKGKVNLWTNHNRLVQTAIDEPFSSWFHITNHNHWKLFSGMVARLQTVWVAASLVCFLCNINIYQCREMWTIGEFGSILY